MFKIVTLAALLIGLSPTTALASSYLTVSFGRAQVGVVPSKKLCDAPPSVSLDDVLAYLQTKGIAATMDVQLSLTQETAETCQSTIKYASWADLQRWQLIYNASAVSAGDVVTDYSSLTDSQVLAHSCGTLQTFTDHGFNAAGMFASPSNSATAHQLALFDSCFGLVRTYNNGKPTLLSKLVAPYKALTYSLTGGRCNNPVLPCYAMAIKNGRVYPDPDQLVAQFNATPDNAWLNFQSYRFVAGTNTAANGWDCSSPDWHDHYTVLPEMFCYNDYQHIIDNLRPDFVSVDPAAIAQLVGR